MSTTLLIGKGSKRTVRLCSREFFADVFAANVIRDADLVEANIGFFGATIKKMEGMIQNELRNGGN